MLGVSRCVSRRARRPRDGDQREMESQWAHALAAAVDREHLEPDYVIPSVFDKRVSAAVSAAVSEAAQTGGVARRERDVTSAVA